MATSNGVPRGGFIAAIDTRNLIVPELVKLAEEGSSKDSLIIKNKYYTCTIGISEFLSLEELSVWHRRNSHARVGAIILLNKRHAFNKSFRPTGSDPLSQLKQVVHDNSVYGAESIFLMIDQEIQSDSTIFGALERFCIENNIEIILLNPTEEQQQELLEEFNEQFGFHRLYEALQCVNWNTGSL